MATDIKEQTKTYRAFSDEQLQEERIGLMFDRAVIESDLEDTGRVDSDVNWAQRAKFSHKMKGILINAVDFEINRRKKAEKSRPTISFAELFMVEALGELDTTTYEYIKERAETVYKELSEVQKRESITLLNTDV